jgi:ParB/RepB/Spo0J family partition protein
MIASLLERVVGKSEDKRETEAEVEGGEAETIVRFLSNAFTSEDPSLQLVAKSDPAAGLTDPSARATARGTAALIEGSRSILDKRRAEMRLDFDERYHGPQGEVRSGLIVRWVEMIPVEAIREDSTFHNMRQSTGTDTFGDLMESMKHEGLKTPITVIISMDLPGCYHVRAGFRRVEAAKKLSWKLIPAIILPPDTPETEEYWTNIVENSARSNLSTYETACAARMMRQRFGVKPWVFAKKAGLSQGYVENLLRAIDRLPDEIIEEWKLRRPIPTDLIFQWSKLTPTEAIKGMLDYQARGNRRVIGNWKPSAEVKARVRELKMSTAQGLSRMGRLRIAIEIARNIDDKTRKLALQVVDFCSGGRSDVPGIYSAESKAKIKEKLRKQEEQESNLEGAQEANPEAEAAPDKAEPPALPTLPVPPPPWKLNE